LKQLYFKAFFNQINLKQTQNFEKLCFLYELKMEKVFSVLMLASSQALGGYSASRDFKCDK